MPRELREILAELIGRSHCPELFAEYTPSGRRIVLEVSPPDDFAGRDPAEAADELLELCGASLPLVREGKDCPGCRGGSGDNAAGARCNLAFNVRLPPPTAGPSSGDRCSRLVLGSAGVDMCDAVDVAGASLRVPATRLVQWLSTGSAASTSDIAACTTMDSTESSPPPPRLLAQERRKNSEESANSRTGSVDGHGAKEGSRGLQVAVIASIWILACALFAACCLPPPFSSTSRSSREETGGAAPLAHSLEDLPPLYGPLNRLHELELPIALPEDSGHSPPLSPPPHSRSGRDRDVGQPLLAAALALYALAAARARPAALADLTRRLQRTFRRSCGGLRRRFHLQFGWFAAPAATEENQTPRGGSAYVPHLADEEGDEEDGKEGDEEEKEEEEEGDSNTREIILFDAGVGSSPTTRGRGSGLLREGPCGETPLVMALPMVPQARPQPPRVDYGASPQRQRLQRKIAARGSLASPSAAAVSEIATSSIANSAASKLGQVVPDPLCDEAAVEVLVRELEGTPKASKKKRSAPQRQPTQTPGRKSTPPEEAKDHLALRRRPCSEHSLTEPCEADQDLRWQKLGAPPRGFDSARGLKNGIIDESPTPAEALATASKSESGPKTQSVDNGPCPALSSSSPSRIAVLNGAGPVRRRASRRQPEPHPKVCQLPRRVACRAVRQVARAKNAPPAAQGMRTEVANAGDVCDTADAADEDPGEQLSRPVGNAEAGENWEVAQSGPRRRGGKRRNQTSALEGAEGQSGSPVEDEVSPELASVDVSTPRSPLVHTAPSSPDSTLPTPAVTSSPRNMPSSRESLSQESPICNPSPPESTCVLEVEHEEVVPLTEHDDKAESIAEGLPLTEEVELCEFCVDAEAHTAQLDEDNVAAASVLTLAAEEDSAPEPACTSPPPASVAADSTTKEPITEALGPSTAPAEHTDFEDPVSLSAQTDPEDPASAIASLPATLAAGSINEANHAAPASAQQPLVLATPSSGWLDEGGDESEEEGEIRFGAFDDDELPPFDISGEGACDAQG